MRLHPNPNIARGLLALSLGCSANQMPVRASTCPDPAPGREQAGAHVAPPCPPTAPASETIDRLGDLTKLGDKPSDPYCRPRLSPELAEVLYQTAEHLIAREGEHVSDGALGVILPLMRLASHSGNRKAQQRYGLYVVGYYETDGMIWPRDKDTAADALAMLHVVAVDMPEQVGEARNWIVEYREPTGESQRFPAEWVKRAKQIESKYRRCVAAAADSGDGPKPE
jgi:hypothetical protein